MRLKSLMTTFAFTGILFLLILTACSPKQNWPQFRGPDGNMLTTVQNLPEEWDTLKNIAWTYKIEGAGWSSPIVWGDKVFITSCFPEKVAPVPERGPQGPPPNTQQGGQGSRPASGQPAPPPPPPPQDNDTTFRQDVYRWEVVCIDLNSGKELWKQVAFHGNPKVKKHQMNNYATETPVTDGKRVYAYFGNMGLFCYDLDGNLLWKKDLGAFNVANGWGTGSSPAIHDGLIFIQNDNEVNSFIVALDAVTGDEKWRVQREEKTNYSTPYIWRNKIRTELIAGGKTARSYDPANGKLLWEMKAGGEQAIPSPVGDENNIYLGNPGGQNTKGSLFAIKAGAEGDITPKEGETVSSGVLWIFPDAALGNSSPLLYKGHIYLIAGRGGEIKCINTSDGSLLFKDRINGMAAVWSSAWAYNDKIWVLDEKGVTRSFKAGGKIDLVNENRFNDKFWPSVAITGKGYVFRGVEALYCVKK